MQVDGVFGPQTRAAVRDFQRGYTFEALGSSGRAGPKTRAALRACVADGGRCSEHFRFREFRSKGDGWIKVDSALVRGLERYRSLLGKPVTIVSGYRDPAHNAAVGGASSSQHLFGNAADIPPALPLARVRDLRAFSGIGVDARTGLSATSTSVTAGRTRPAGRWRTRLCSSSSTPPADHEGVGSPSTDADVGCGIRATRIPSSFRSAPSSTVLWALESWPRLTGGALPRRALDIGCGTGRNVAYLARQGVPTTGFDASPRAIELARERLRTAGDGTAAALHPLGLASSPSGTWGTRKNCLKTC